MASEAQQTWATAQRARRGIIKFIGQLKQDAGDKNEETQLERIETVLSDFRLCCVQTIFLDFKFAAKHDVDGLLWQVHTFVNSEYRGLLGRFKVPQQVVTKRKVEKMYLNYLRTSQYFYKGYIQRLWARYELPQLERIAECIRLETMPNAAADREEVAQVEREVIKSCHDTLLHLGDLSRYRAKARQKLQASETALTYYGLAHDLNPDSGFAHHQMGVIYLEDKKHFDIVYHFYRSWAVEVPHPNAANNLEVEFKNVVIPSTPGKRPGPPDKHHAFTSWFVRLHARFFKGAVFSQHAELEEEVLHRFEMTLKTQDVLPLLLKVVLINMSAYDIAKAKVNREWTLSTSRSCQYILRLNVRTILILSRLLKSEMTDATRSQALELDGKQPETTLAGPGDSGDFSAFAENILPLLRLYLAWICAYRADLVKYEEHLEPFVYDMYRALGSSATTLISEFGKKDLAASPYLLTEDVEALGLKPLDDPALPADCRLQRIAEKGVRKPRIGDFGCARKTPREEMLSRIYDIISCIFFLATDPVFPLEADPGKGDALESVNIRYAEGGLSIKLADQTTTSSIAAVQGAKVGELTGKLNKLQASPPPHQPEATASSRLSQPGSLDHSAHHTEVAYDTDARSIPAGSTGLQPGITDDADIDADFSIDRDMYNMVNDFLAPPESRTHSATEDHAETSYGMHSSTANEIFGDVHPKSPAPNSANAKAFPTLPWNYFISPTPIRQGQGIAMGSPEGNGYTTSPDPWLPMQGAQPQNPLVSRALQPRADASSSLSFNPGASWGRPEQGDPSSLGALPARSRNEPAGHYYTGSTDSEGFPGLRHAGNSAWDSHGLSQAANASHGNAYDDPQVRASFEQEQAPFPSTVFSPQTSSLPPLNSPWGLPAVQRVSGPQSGEPVGFRQPFPGAPSSAYDPQSNSSRYQSMECNGNFYNATTAFGRGPIANKDDPTHFKNAVKKTHVAAAVEAADEYDKAILASALGDGNP